MQAITEVQLASLSFYPSLEQLSPFYLKVPQHLLIALCCLLSILSSHCSVFKVQTSDPFQDQIEMLGRLPKHFNLFLVEVTGLEPVTPCLQSKCSTS